MPNEKNKYTPPEDSEEGLNNCTDDEKGIYINPKLHKTPKQWVEFLSEKYDLFYKTHPTSIFKGWLRDGVPKKVGGGEFKTYYKVSSETTLYEWIKKKV